ncbi:hypothetical protein ACFQ6U_23825 [Streptomyces sp. NPDC056465]|uniref:hypothetical protein n=1 Tax=unclassified Streptomyces TaxID=2593676 RepID=UPI0035D581F4
MLEDLGLTPEEERVYRALVGRADATEEEMADGAPPGTGRSTAAALASLRRRGLVTAHPDGRRFMAASPELSLGAELIERREGLQRAEHALSALVEAYRTGSMVRGQRELVEVVEGVEAVQQRYIHLQLSARRTIDFFSTGGHEAVGPETTQEHRALHRGVKLRGVVDESFLRQPRGTDNLDEAVADGTAIRTTRDIPLKLIICDGEAAMLPLRGHGTDVDPSILLRGGLVNVARALFDSVWERALPYGEINRGAGENTDARLLQLLLAGLTDTAAAKQLGLSTRTVQRRVQTLMSRAGVSTRLQLGWHARHHHWV